MRATAKRTAILTISFVALAACVAKAPPEVTQAYSVATTDAPAIDACWRRVLASPPHQALRSRMGDHADSPTTAMKTNPEKATAEDAAQLASLQRDYLAPCRKLALESAGKVHPTVVAILSDSYAKADENAALLMAGKITWGEYVSENQALVTQRRAELLAAGERLQRDLPSSR